MNVPKIEAILDRFFIGDPRERNRVAVAIMAEIEREEVNDDELTRDLARELIENKTHPFDPGGRAHWAKPRCNVCQEFEDHPIHKDEQ